jgi:hypothetical protein
MDSKSNSALGGKTALVSIDTVIIDGRKVPNLKAPPEEWRLGRPCPRKAEYAAALGWTNAYIATGPQDAHAWLLERLRALIIPSNLPFVLPHNNRSRAHLFWRHAKHGLGVSGLDERTCVGLRSRRPRITCIVPSNADASKLLAVSHHDILITSPDHIVELSEMGDVEVGCAEGWRMDGTYVHPTTTHHPTPCALLDVISNRGSRQVD